MFLYWLSMVPIIQTAQILNLHYKDQIKILNQRYKDQYKTESVVNNSPFTTINNLPVSDSLSAHLFPWLQVGKWPQLVNIQ